MKRSALEIDAMGESGRQDKPEVYVLKFGSSVFRTIDDLPRIAGEIYRQRRAGRRIIAVVSALEGETNRLFAEAAEVTGSCCCRGIPALVSQGEERSAALLRIACDRIGLTAAICRPEDLGLHAVGDSDVAAEPARLEPDILLAKLAQTGLVIVPGFVGLGEDGERVLLGRGGSDFSAIFIAGEIGATCIRLYKDVDGVFDRDPAANADARHFSEISWTDTLEVARPLIQPQAVEYAASKALTIEVERIGSRTPTRVGPCTGAAELAAPDRRIRVSIAGYGVVGQALAERLRSEPGINVVAILVRDTSRARQVSPPVRPTSDPRAFLGVATDVVVDALSCEETGAFLYNVVLPSGRHVVSASKRAIATGHGRFSRLAAANGVALRYSAAVGGSAPILETVDRARASGPIKEFAGILNGTVNFILDRVHGGSSFHQALLDARAAGFAEENCDFDLTGADAVAKLRLIAMHAFGIEPQELEVTTEALDEAVISHMCAERDRWVQIGRVAKSLGGLTASVTLQRLASLNGPTVPDREWNAALVRLEDGREFACQGRGAGGAATAEAITADLFDIASMSCVEDVLPTPMTSCAVY